jgi:hypothetical protein
VRSPTALGCVSDVLNQGGHAKGCFFGFWHYALRALLIPPPSNPSRQGREGVFDLDN